MFVWQGSIKSPKIAENRRKSELADISLSTLQGRFRSAGMHALHAVNALGRVFFELFFLMIFVFGSGVSIVRLKAGHAILRT